MFHHLHLRVDVRIFLLVDRANVVAEVRLLDIP